MATDTTWRDRIADYLAQQLSAEEIIEFRRQLDSDPELARELQAHEQIAKLERSVRDEQYQFSPGFAHKVMDAVQRQRAPSALAWLRQHVRNRIWAGASTAVVALIALFMIRQQAVREIPVHFPESPSKYQGLLPPHEKAPEPIWSFDPFRITAPGADVGGEAAFGGRNDGVRFSELAQLLNTLEQPFPVGAGLPVAISYELVRSPTSDREALLRISLSGAEDHGGISAERLELQLKFGSAISDIRSVLNEKAQWVGVQPSTLTVARGAKLLFGQQYSVLLMLRLREPTQQQIATVTLTYTVPDADEPKEQHAEIYGSAAIPLARSLSESYFSGLFK